MSVIAPIMLGAATALKAIGQIREGRAMAQAEQYNARVAEMQAKSIEQAAAFEKKTISQSESYERARLAREKKKMTATQRARYISSGVRADIGSPLAVMADTAAEYELDIAASRYRQQLGLARVGYEADVEKSLALSEAGFRKGQAKRYKRAGYWGAGETLLTSTRKFF